MIFVVVVRMPPGSKINIDPQNGAVFHDWKSILVSFLTARAVVIGKKPKTPTTALFSGEFSVVLPDPDVQPFTVDYCKR